MTGMREAKFSHSCWISLRMIVGAVVWSVDEFRGAKAAIL